MEVAEGCANCKVVKERRELLSFCIDLERVLKRDCYVTFIDVPKPLKTMLDKMCGPEKHKKAGKK